ncbi:MAG TPA: bifunctional UDP-N-acetylglucosamine diphosphorylase/glucosamine-1-phosphate N-acetyltransferase GlmU [Thermoanaerobaculia bacterium]|nr:bifunctional UDP-N-acetylglucosamine diphosphorylase/glucosamine-1-phosphate N-acetyltransferase GlmU [Thermoanaerobaculia bacterium]
MGKTGRQARQTWASDALRVVVLAAGEGTRMRSTLPKVLHRVAERTLIDAVLDAVAGLGASQTVVVLGAGREQVSAALSGRAVDTVVQDAPRGTGDAIRRALPALSDGAGPVLVLSGDTPLILPETLARLVARRAEGDLAAVFLSSRPPDPGGFGRVVRDRSGRVRAIVEAKNASSKQKKIGEVNAGIACFEAKALARAIGALRENPVSREIDLTDAVAALCAAGLAVDAIVADDWREACRVNTRRDLAVAEEIERRRAIERALDAGVTVMDPSTTRIGPRVALEPDVVLHPFVSLEGSTRIAEGCEVFSFTRIADSTLATRASVGPHCDVEGASVGERARVGPYARLRPGTVLEEDVRVGNFVETKQAVLRRGVKALHLSYLGDAEIGAEANIGAGVITCNYDGVNKNRTSIGAGAFIGSDSQLVAPVSVGRGAYVGAGSTITEDVPDGALALTRSPQQNKPGWAAKRRARNAKPETRNSKP